VPLISRSVQRTSAAIAASVTLFTLLLAGCNNDKASSAAPSSTASAGTSSASSADSPALDNVKAGTFVVSYRNAFPKLAEGKDDAGIRDILVETCKDIKDGKAEDPVVQNVITRTKTGSVQATKEEAQAIYQMAKMLC
jgi:PBP1b-binding outer membrane lipoprotein LpoB